MLELLKRLFFKKQATQFFVEIHSQEQEQEQDKTRWDEISEMEIPSREKIKLVEIQEIPVEKGDILEAKRKHKKYTIELIPQTPNCFEHDTERKITVYVRAGSKHEALQTLSLKLSGKHPFYGDSNDNAAIAGRWYDGNRYLLEIISFERNTKKT